MYSSETEKKLLYTFLGLSMKFFFVKLIWVGKHFQLEFVLIWFLKIFFCSTRLDVQKKFNSQKKMVGKCGQKRDSNKIHSRTIFGRHTIYHEIFFLRLQNLFLRNCLLQFFWGLQLPRNNCNKIFVENILQTKKNKIAWSINCHPKMVLEFILLESHFFHIFPQFFFGIKNVFEHETFSK